MCGSMKPSKPICISGRFWRSPLPRKKDLVFFRSSGGSTVVDLTQRERPQVARWCAELGLKYKKLPTPYEGFDPREIAARVAEFPGQVLIHCFHGRDRTGAVAAEIERMLNANQCS